MLDRTIRVRVKLKRTSSIPIVDCRMGMTLGGRLQGAWHVLHRLVETAPFQHQFPLSAVVDRGPCKHSSPSHWVGKYPFLRTRRCRSVLFVRKLDAVIAAAFPIRRYLSPCPISRALSHNKRVDASHVRFLEPLKSDLRRTWPLSDHK